MIKLLYRFGVIVPLLVAVGLRYFAQHSPLLAEAWDPPQSLPTLSRNTKLVQAQAEPILQGKLLGPESMAIDKSGRHLYTGLMDGRIVKIDLETLDMSEFARYNLSCSAFVGKYNSYPPHWEPICGRPLGLRLDPQGRLVVAESYRGIHRLSADGSQRQVLLEHVMGRRIALANDLDVSSSTGEIFFTEYSDRWGRNQIIYETLASRRCGALVSFHPDDPTNTLQVYKGFTSCNGVSLSHDESAVYFVCSPKIYRLDLATRTVSVALDNMPGLLDNIRKRKQKNRFLVGASSSRSAPFSLADSLARYPLIRNLIYRLVPQRLILQLMPQIGLLIQVDLTPGHERIVDTYQDPRPAHQGGLHYLSEAEENDKDGYMYIGSWHENHLVRVKSDKLFGSDA